MQTKHFMKGFLNGRQVTLSTADMKKWAAEPSVLFVQPWIWKMAERKCPLMFGRHGAQRPVASIRTIWKLFLESTEIQHRHSFPVFDLSCNLVIKSEQVQHHLTRLEFLLPSDIPYSPRIKGGFFEDSNPFYIADILGSTFSHYIWDELINIDSMTNKAVKLKYAMLLHSEQK